LAQITSHLGSLSGAGVVGRLSTTEFAPEDAISRPDSTRSVDTKAVNGELHLMETMNLVASMDGTRIAYWLSGDGPYLVLVHGMCADHTRFPKVLPRLQEHFTVCAVDRRGRGGSGDASEYTVEQEFEDISVVCDSLDGPVNLFGHSYGGLCALGAASRTSSVSKLILYEPTVDIDEPLYPSAVVSEMEHLLQIGNRDEMMVTFLREIVEVPEQEIESLRTDASWEELLANAHTVPREIKAGIPHASQFRNVSIPTLVLTGETSATVDIDSAKAVHAVLPNSQLVTFPGEGHIAMITAPHLFVDAVLSFLME
jgi:pimeloyl-ACP methyl ester carboxylesterase